MSSTAGVLRIETIDGDVRLGPGEEFTFGRSLWCTFCVDEQDRNISRRAGLIAYEEGSWVLSNTSDTRPFSVFDTDRMTRRELLAGQRHPLDARCFRISLPGSRRAHFEFTIVNEALEDDQSDLGAGEGARSPKVGTPTLGAPELSRRQRLDVAALSWEWHDPPGRRGPRPLTYDQAARRLRCTPKSLERRVSELRSSLVRRGYQQLDDLAMMCSFLVTGCRAVGPEDFGLLDHDPVDKGGSQP